MAETVKRGIGNAQPSPVVVLPFARQFMPVNSSMIVV
jgi:hypothetical protein